MNTRVANKRTNLGKTYLLNMNTSTTNIANENTTWFIKKKGTNCGMLYLFTFMVYNYSITLCN